MSRARGAERITAMRRSLVWLVWASVALAAVPTLVLLGMRGPRPLEEDLFGGVGGAAFVLLALACSTVGAIIVARVPGNRVGPIFLALGWFSAAAMLAYAYASYGVSREAPLPSGTRWAAWWGLGELVAPLLGLALLYFPDGRLPSRRWRPAAVIGWMTVAVLTVSSSFVPGAIAPPFETLTNPVGIPGARDVLSAANQTAWVLVLVGMAIGLVATRVRLRRAHGDELQQLRLVLSVGAIVAAVVTLSLLTWFIWPEDGLQPRMAVIGVSFSAFAAAIGLAILRYRLYDVDIVISARSSTAR